jgi:hypothetical protein
MSYRVVHVDLVIGETDLEGSLDRDWRGAFRPLPSFQSVERTLRPYGSAVAVETIDESGGSVALDWVGDNGRSLPALDLRLVDSLGRPLSAQQVRLYWPGDIPGVTRLEIQAWGESTLPTTDNG